MGVKHDKKIRKELRKRADMEYGKLAQEQVRKLSKEHKKKKAIMRLLVAITLFNVIQSAFIVTAVTLYLIK